MNAIKLLIALGIAGLAYQYWSKHHQGSELASAAVSAESPSPGGFVALPGVEGTSPNKVLIVAAENCPEEAARRADDLAERLARNGIPVSRVHNVSFDIPNADASVAERVMSVMNGELPIVFVHGRTKSNPGLEEVMAEYKASGR